MMTIIDFEEAEKDIMKKYTSAFDWQAKIINKNHYF